MREYEYEDNKRKEESYRAKGSINNNGKKKISHRKKHRRVAFTRLMILLIFAISLGLYYFKPEEKIIEDTNKNENNTVEVEEEDKEIYETKKKDKWSFILGQTDKDIVLVNKENLLKKNYVPEDLVSVNIKFSPEVTAEERLMTKEAAEAIVKLVHGAEKDGIYLYGLSGYRSYLTQDKLYNYNLSTQGYDYTNQYVAKAGTSEHQLGLAMDLATEGGWITEDCEEAIWLSDNAYKYGFIVRYEKGKEEETGYSYEPWHIRYVGEKAAKEIYTKGITLEEYCK